MKPRAATKERPPYWGRLNAFLQKYAGRTVLGMLVGILSGLIVSVFLVGRYYEGVGKDFELARQERAHQAQRIEKLERTVESLARDLGAMQRSRPRRELILEILSEARDCEGEWDWWDQQCIKRSAGE